MSGMMYDVLVGNNILLGFHTYSDASVFLSASTATADGICHFLS